MHLCGYLRAIADTDRLAPVPHIIAEVYQIDSNTMQVDHEWFGGKLFFFTKNVHDLVRCNKGRLALYIAAPTTTRGVVDLTM